MSKALSKSGVDSALQAMAEFCECSDVTPRHLMTFLFVASRGPVLLSQFAAHARFTHGSLDETVAYLAQRDQNGQGTALITIFSATDRSDRWLAPTARGRELFSLIQRSADTIRIAA